MRNFDGGAQKRRREGKEAPKLSVPHFFLQYSLFCPISLFRHLRGGSFLLGLFFVLLRQKEWKMGGLPLLFFFFAASVSPPFLRASPSPPFSILPPDGEREEEEKEEEGKQQSGERRKEEKPIPDQPCRRPRMRGEVGHSTNQRSPA